MEGAPSGDGAGSGVNKFDQLCDNANTAMVTLNNSLQEFFGFKDELMKYNLPPKLLVHFTLISSQVFRCYSDLCTPMGELVRMVKVNSGPWLEKGAGLAKLRDDYNSMQRRFNIALKRIELMAAKEERMDREQRIRNWEKLYSKVMLSKSHGRRWKFRIEPFKRKLEEGFNPYASEDSDDSEEEEGERVQQSRRLTSPMEGSLAEEEEEEEEELRDLVSDSEGGLGSELSRSLSALQKRVRFADNSDGFPGSPVEAALLAPPPVETSEASTSTSDPLYDNYLLLQMYRPAGLLQGQDVCCTVSLGDQFHSSEAFPAKPQPAGSSLLTHQFFRFALSECAGRVLEGEEPLDSLTIPKLNVAVYPRSISEEMAAHLSLPLRELTLTEAPTVIVPPDSRPEEEEGEGFAVQWGEVEGGVQGLPTEYALSPSTSSSSSNQGEGETLPLLPLTCHRVKVQRHSRMHSGTSTGSIEELLTELGYRLVPELQSRAVSAIALLEKEEVEGEGCDGERGEGEGEEGGGRVSQEQLAALTQQHEEETASLRSKHQEKLDTANGALAKLREEKNRKIKELETALLEALQSKGKKGRADMKEPKQPPAAKLTSHGLPEWGRDLPPDFLDRLEMFSDESARKQMELTERIKQEVSEACEKQLATQHKLAPGLRTDIDSTTEDVSLPALFMPTPSSKPLIFTPRAHSYFHPPGSMEPRVTQPPAIFKLPTLNTTHMATMNLFELSQQFSHSGPQWLKEHTHQSPALTPAPPPSACGYYHGNHDSPQQQQQQQRH